MRLHQCLDWWAETWALPFVSAENTRRFIWSKVQIVKRLTPDDPPMRRITDERLQQVLVDMAEQGYADSTARHIRTMLRRVWRRAIRARYATVDAAEMLRIPAGMRVRIVHPFTHAEQAIVEGLCAHMRHGDRVIFLLRTGLRRGEMLNLRWEDYDPEQGQIRIIASKTAAGRRVVPLTAEAKDLIEAQPRVCEYIWTSGGAQLCVATLSNQFLQLRRRGGLAHAHPHMCRHTYITRCVESGMSLKAIAQLVGHVGTDMIMRVYAEYELEALRDELCKLKPT